MDKSQLRAACEERLARLELPHRFGTQQLRQAVAAMRGKPIVLRALPNSAADAPCGIRVETPTADVLFVEQGTSAAHQMHILAHEISHILCDHPGSLALGDDVTSAIGLNPTLVQRMSGRTAYTTTDEREAELMATLIRQRVYRERLLPARRPTVADERWDAIFA
ncbi:regulator component [Kitasatospora sp. NBC_01287]|uniref:regulator component n=1 Tax=Kitasatospora sp. NBC_01287 TaxID=2903573 RepID=UPI002258ED96|nr:regulator component [Kitasatospora sp. NBC_01287]MCX4751213.1 regulator component [Kitasatospora sp. NBC_01287]